jgi:hypothetical protein
MNRCELGKSAGVEIIDGAEPIQNHPFDGNTAFLLGNEGQVCVCVGLSCLAPTVILTIHQETSCPVGSYLMETY